MIVTLDEQHRLTVPAAVCQTDVGEQFDACFDDDQAAIVFRRIQRTEDWLDVLSACPVAMDDLPSRSKELPKQREL